MNPTTVAVALCKAPSCEYAAIVDNPETVYDAAQKLANHYNEEHDAIDREIAFERYDEWGREDYEPYNAETGDTILK